MSTKKKCRTASTGSAASGVRSTPHEKIAVKVGDEIEWKEVPSNPPLHGPIVAHKDGKSYSVAIPYANEVRLMDESWGMVTAHNLAEMKKALSMLQLMAQNIMVGTVDGDIYYVRNGRVPVRPKGCDPSQAHAGIAGRVRVAGDSSVRGPGADHQSRRRDTCRTATSRRSP